MEFSAYIGHCKHYTCCACTTSNNTAIWTVMFTVVYYKLATYTPVATSWKVCSVYTQLVLYNCGTERFWKCSPINDSSWFSSLHKWNIWDSCLPKEGGGLAWYNVAAPYMYTYRKPHVWSSKKHPPQKMVMWWMNLLSLHLIWYVNWTRGIRAERHITKPNFGWENAHSSWPP